jgi:serine/threonine protein phosphatase PrpC
MMTIRPKAFDMKRVKLSAQEGFVLSRVVGTVTVGDLVDLSGLDETTVRAIVQRLSDEGTVDVDPPLASAAPAAPDAPDPLGNFGEIDEPATPAPPEADAKHDARVCGMSDVGVARSNNEDAFRIAELGARGLLLVVCDGMGGENAGEVASALAVDAIVEHVSAAAIAEDAADTLRAAVDHANARVVAASVEPGRKGMGTTVVAVLVRDGHAYTAEIGDSRAYVLRGGALTQITKDQTYVALLLEQGLLAPEAVKGSVAKNVVLQAVGKAPSMLVAQRRLSLRGGDQLLLCSDGLSSYVKDEEIRGVLAKGAPLEQACTELIAMANARGGHDNVTVVTALIDGEYAQRAFAPGETFDETLTTLRPYAVGEPADDDPHAD